MAPSDHVRLFFRTLQESICEGLEAEEDGDASFLVDDWTRSDRSSGSTRVLSEGSTLEKAGVNYSHFKGPALPGTASERHPHLRGAPFEVAGVSVVIHPRNPYVPTSHFNVRFFEVFPEGAPPVFWFGGGFDLTPYYPFPEDILHWHRTAKACCDPFGKSVYAKLKAQCDAYFFNTHRRETRGVGGLFFDDWDRGGFDAAFNLARSVGLGFMEAYRPILHRRKETPYSDRERHFQLQRRGRYAEFNLVYDRGTLFGLQSGGRIESILMSLPPLVRWDYQPDYPEGSPEARLADFLRPRDWLKEVL